MDYADRGKHLGPFTFVKWQSLFYNVTKGQKATGRDEEGTATFTREQVTANSFSADEDIENYLAVVEAALGMT